MAASRRSPAIRPGRCWHYQRQLKVVVDQAAPEGQRYITFSNTLPGRNGHALQGFAVDGRRVGQLQLSARVRGKDLRSGQSSQQVPAIVITFYDENRATVGEAVLGPWLGSFDWQAETKRIVVPPKAREAILRIGLLGAVGEISFDQIELRAGGRKKGLATRE
jgi:protein-L-isoaspartate(D-aspartate) O-methyltransferase